MPSSTLHPLSSLLLAGLLWSVALCAGAAPEVLRGELSIHDPSTIVKCEGEYWVFGTGRGV
ncbi:MAG TPA: arabinan endo-1,5-alpha-L-arabinosidase, partial [Bacillota bacterium]|nr:arabinan endo-1,5-alpha-L-arabinosidase [Bacillota bacterium]